MRRVKAIIEQEQARQTAEQERAQAELQARAPGHSSGGPVRRAQTRVLNGGQVYQGTLPQTDNAILNQVVQTAAAYLGIPYVWGGSKPSTGMDCSGFVRYVFKQHGVILPHYSGYQAQMGVPVAPADIQPGDLVAFGFPVHHVGIYIGDGLFIHTPGRLREDLEAEQPARTLRPSGASPCKMQHGRPRCSSSFPLESRHATTSDHLDLCGLRPHPRPGWCSSSSRWSS